MNSCSCLLRIARGSDLQGPEHPWAIADPFADPCPFHSPKPCINMQEPMHTEAKVNKMAAK